MFWRRGRRTAEGSEAAKPREKTKHRATKDMNANWNYSKYSATIQIFFTIQIRSATIQIQQYEKWMSTQGHSTSLHAIVEDYYSHYSNSSGWIRDVAFAIILSACNGGNLLFPLGSLFRIRYERRFRDYITRILTLLRYYISQDLWQAGETKNIRPGCAPMLA